MKTIFAIICLVVPFLVYATSVSGAVLVPVTTIQSVTTTTANYTMTSTTSLPVDSLGEPDDDPEQPISLTTTQQTTALTDLISEITTEKQIWQARQKAALSRLKSDPSLK